MSNKTYVTKDMTNHKIINLATPTSNYDAATMLYVTSSISTHTGLSVGAHAASAISFTPTGNTSSTDVQSAIVEIQSQLDGVPIYDQSLNKANNVQFNNLILTGNLTVHGTITSINTSTIDVADLTITLGDTSIGSPSTTPTDVTANGGGLILKGATDKTFTWLNSVQAWTSSENLNLVTGKVYEINGTSVLSNNTLGSGVIYSSLTSLGTIGTGVWQGNIIEPTYGGTGINNGSKTITLGGNLTTSGAFTTTLTVTASTSVTLPTTGTLSTLDGSETFTNKTLTSPKINDTAVLTSTSTDLNILHSTTVTSTEINYVHGVTSAIQTQLNTKTQKFASTITLVDSTPLNVTHGLNSTDVIAKTYYSGAEIELTINIVDANNITVEAESGITGVRLVVIG